MTRLTAADVALQAQPQQRSTERGGRQGRASAPAAAQQAQQVTFGGRVQTAAAPRAAAAAGTCRCNLTLNLP